MRVLAIIPSRYASSRFPGKPLIDLNGKSMIRRVYEGVNKSAKINHTIVATDDGRIVDEVKRFGGNVVMTSINHRNGTGRCIEVAKALDSYEIVINIQGDEPLVKSEHLDALIDAFSDDSVTIATLAIEKSSIADFYDENRIKVVVDHQSNALYFSRSPIPKYNKDANPTKFLKHIGIYAFRRETLLQTEQMPPVDIEKIESLEQLRWMYHGKKIKVLLTNIETPNIDVPADVKKVLKLL